MPLLFFHSSFLSAHLSAHSFSFLLDARAAACSDVALTIPGTAMTIDLGLLLAGIALGPATGVLDPDKLLGDLLFPTVSLAVALILFEGSLTLRFHELPGIGKAVRGLVSYGAVASLLLLTLATHLIAGLAWPIALLFGA